MAVGGYLLRDDRSFVKGWLFLCCLVIFFLPLNLLASKQAYPLEYITINDGLSDNYITCIHQDKLGYLWLGTMDGINRYDGSSFVIFRNIPGDSLSISDNFIKSIDENESGDLYITTNTGGLNHFNRQREEFHHKPLRSETGGRDESLSIVKCGDKRVVWIGTQDGFLYGYNTYKDSVEYSVEIVKDFPNSNQNVVSDIYLDFSGKIWVASGLGGLDVFDPQKGLLQHVFQADTLEETFRRNGCGKIIEDDHGSLWVSRTNGLSKYNPGSGDSEHYSFLDSKREMLKSFSLALNTDREIILSSYYDLLEFDPQTLSHEIFASVLPKYFSSALYLDASDIIWAGTMGYGLIKIDPSKHQFNTTAGNFLGDIHSEVITLFENIPGVDLSLRDRDFLSIIRDRNGDTWIATQFWGLFHVDHQSRTLKKYSIGELDDRQRYQAMYEVHEDRQGDIWVSTVGGLSKLDRNSGTFEYYRLYPGTDTDRFAINKASYLDISCIHEDEMGVFWLGTPELGLIQFHPVDGTIRYFPITISGSSEKGNFPILSITPDLYEDILWIGTEGGGLARFAKPSKETLFLTVKDGLPNNTVNAVLAGGKHDLWMSTNMGISRYTPETGQFLNFDVRDGLQSNGYNRREAYQDTSGVIYFGGPYGYNYFQPDEIVEDRVLAPIALTGIELLNESINFKDSKPVVNEPWTLLDNLILDHEQGMMVSFNYAALTYSNPYRDRFVYKLNGFDSRWIENGTKRSAVYTNLAPGEYLFRVRHHEQMNNKAAQELSLSLTILPPFWATWWFRILLLALSVILVVLLIMRELNKVNQKRIRQQQFSQQLLGSQEDERKRISGELHDGIGQNLLVIKNTLQLGLNNMPSNEQSNEFFQSASDIVSETIQEVRQISHNLSPQHLEQLGLTSTLESVIENVDRVSPIHFSMKLDDIDGLLPVESEIQVYRIVQESLNNILKHSQATEAKVVINKFSDTISIMISDNGVGFSGFTEGKGIGLAGMQERAQLLQGQIRIEPGIESGTSVHLTLKVDT